MKHEYCWQILGEKILIYQISWKSVQWQPTISMWTEGQTDMTKLIIAFRNLAEALKKTFQE